MPTTITNWHAQSAQGEYCPPSAMLNTFISGMVSGHPTLPNGTVGRFDIASAGTTSFTDAAGVTYTLGAPDPAWAAWCFRQGMFTPTTTAPLRGGSYAGAQELPVYSTTLFGSQNIAPTQRCDIFGPFTIPAGVTLTIQSGGLLKVFMDDYWRFG